MSYKSVALSLSPKGLWMFDEASGTTINDTSGNAQNGTYSTVTLGATSLISDPGGNGTAATFSGTSGQWLGSIPNSATIALTSFTVVMWFKFTGSTAFAVPVSMASEQAASSGFELVRNNVATSSEERVDTPTSNNQLLAVGSTLFDGSTHMVAVGITGSTAFQSVDAGTYITGAISGTYAAPAVDLFFGNSANHVSDPLSAVGTYQGAAMFSGQLSQANLTSLYNAGLGIGISPIAIFSHRHRTHFPVPRLHAKRPIRFRPLWKLPLSPFPNFPEQIRHRAKKVRIPVVKAKPPVRQRWITERQVTAPHADFPQQLRHQQQRHKIPKVKTTKPLRTRWINTRLVTAPYNFPEIIRRRQQKHRLPKVPRTKLNKNKIELTIPQAPPQVAPAPIFARKQRRRLPKVRAKAVVRNRLIDARLITAPYDHPPVLPRTNQRRRVARVKVKLPVRNRLIDERLVTAPYPPHCPIPLPLAVRHRQRKRVPFVSKRASLMMLLGRAAIIAVITGDIARWRFQRRNIGVQGRVRSSTKHGDV